MVRFYSPKKEIDANKTKAGGLLIPRSIEDKQLNSGSCLFSISDESAP